MLRLFLLLYLGLFVAHSQAAQFYDLVVDARSRSLGMATTAFIDDYSALYRNPAGLALRADSELRIFDYIYAAYSKDVLNAFQNLSSVTSGGSQTPAQQLVKLDRLAFGLDFRPLGFGAYFKSLALGVHLADTQFRLRFRTPNPLFANIKFRATSDYGLSLGLARSFMDKKLRLGLAVRPILVRAGMDANINATQLASYFSGNAGISDFFENNKEKTGLGLGFDADVGAQGEWEPFQMGIWRVKPMWGVAWQNLMASSFHVPLSNQYEGRPPALQRKLNTGVAFRLMDVGTFQPTWSIEWRDIGPPTDSLIEHFCTGAELQMLTEDWFRTSMRAHWARGNWGGGLGFRIYAAEVEFGTFAENLGAGPGIGVDRRYHAIFSTAW